MDTLSRKGQGQPKDFDISGVASGMNGSFVVSDAAIDFSHLDFGVNGASVDLNGTYDVDSGLIDFHGKLSLAAKLSQTMTGPKSFFLKALDPFFEGKNAGTVLPIKITGTKRKSVIRVGSSRRVKQDRGSSVRKRVNSDLCWFCSKCFSCRYRSRHQDRLSRPVRIDEFCKRGLCS